jgi:hypothetical protein
MAVEDWIDVAEPPDDWQNEDGITCKFCGENYLTWEEVRGLPPLRN